MKQLLLTSFLLALVCGAQAQVIVTYAGGGSAGLGDGGPAVYAELNSPYGINLDDSGNLYICDLLNERIRKVGNPNILGTDHSTWGGIIVKGDHSFPQYLAPLATFQCQGLCNFSAAEISYADIAIQSGADAADGGGWIEATYGPNRFYNNKEAVVIWPYSNVSSSGVISNSVANLNQTTFYNDNNAWFTAPDFVRAYSVKAVQLFYCSFGVPAGITAPAAVVGTDAGFAMGGSTFNNFQTAVHASYSTATHSLFVGSCIFNGNHIALQDIGGVVPSVTQNTFNIPKFMGGPHSLYPGTTNVVMINGQNIGALMMGATGYNLSQNNFQTSAPPISHYYSFTTGTIEWNTTSEPNQVVGNRFSRLGAAMQSNFVNNNPAAGVGLRYLCDTDVNTGYDIAVCGYPAATGGISLIQASNVTSSSFAPAGNIFSGVWNLWDQQEWFYYVYNGSIPGEAPLPLAYTPSTVHPVNFTNSPTCNIIASSSSHAYAAYSPNQLADTVLHYAITTANVNYYMMDDSGMQHRDSLYYWAGQMGTASGDLLVANLLIEDGMTDSANIVYNAIATKYSLDSIEANEFTQGRNLMDILITQRVNNNGLFGLDSAQVDSLNSIVANCNMWAHVRAESWLNMYNGRPFSDTLLYPGDSISSYPPQPPGVLAVTEISQGPAYGCQYAEMIVANCGSDTGQYVSVEGWILDDNSGVFSDGVCDPSVGVNQGHYRLAYDGTWANVPVGSVIVLYNHDVNCYNLPDTFTLDTLHQIYWVPIGGTVGSAYGNPHVEMYTGVENASICSYCSDTGATIYTTAAAWMSTIGLDSMMDGFQVLCPGCTAAIPAAPSYYFGVGFLSIDSTIYIPVGLSDTVVVNINNSDTLSIGSVGSGGTSYGGGSLATTLYPGFGSANINLAPRYTALATSTSFGTSIALVTGIGTAVLGGSGYKKYMFYGGSTSDLLDSTQWIGSGADTAGVAPPSLGNVDSTLYSQVLAHSVGFPCCSGLSARHSNPNKPKTTKGTVAPPGLPQGEEVIRVYPNPANTMLYFEFTATGEVTIKMMDVTGRVMDEQVIENGSAATFNVGGYVPGVYMYQLIMSGKTQSGKVVVGK